MSARKIRKNTGEAWRFMTRLLWRAELQLQETKMLFNAASCLQACITKLTSVNLMCPAPARQPNEQAHQRQDKGFKTCGEICTGSEQRATTVHDCKKLVADCDCNQEKLFVSVSWIPAKTFEFQFLFWTSGLEMAKVHEAATKYQMSQNDSSAYGNSSDACISVRPNAVWQGDIILFISKSASYATEACLKTWVERSSMQKVALEGVYVNLFSNLLATESLIRKSCNLGRSGKLLWNLLLNLST